MEEKRCTQATLEALGVMGKCPKTGLGVIEALCNAGLRIRTLPEEKYRRGLRDFIADHQVGRFYICSEGHAMALVDGRLTDTSRRAITNRIKVLGAVRIVES